MKRAGAALGLAASLLVSSVAAAASPGDTNYVYVEYGQWDSAREGVVGIQTPWPIHFEGEQWTTFWQAEVGEWFTKKYGRDYQPSTELALGPVGRYYFTASHDFYFDAIVNLSLVAPRFWRDAEQQGTIYNFVGGAAFGYRFGARGTDEISFRAEHFSNGGIDPPNPGRNFFQLRYARAL